MVNKKGKIAIVFITILFIAITLISVFCKILPYVNQLFLGEALFTSDSWSHGPHWYITEKGYICNSVREIGKYIKYPKITNEELNKLKKLANEVEDETENYIFSEWMMSGGHSQKIYSERLSKWIVLSARSSNSSTKNLTPIVVQEILDFANELYIKYLR